MEVGQVKYYVYVITEQKLTVNITQAVFGLGWGENEDELSMRMTFSMYNALYENKRLSSIIKIGQTVIIKSNWGNGTEEVARGTIKEAERDESKSDETFNIVVYDILFTLQKSQDDVFFTSGKTTKAVIQSIFKSWGITLDKYTGPNVVHGKLVYRGKGLASIILDILSDAVKKGGCKASIVAEKGKVSIIKVGSNKDVYVFDTKNSIQSKYKVSIVDMVTRIKIVTSDSKKTSASKVEATVDKNTDYGIVQQIKTLSKSDSLSEAKKEAKEILDEKGVPKKTMTLEAPDVPPIRKGWKINVTAGSLKGDYIVKSIQHNADSGKMVMQIEAWKEKEDTASKKEKETKKETKKTYKVGDKVSFKGGKHYVSSDKGATGYKVSAGPAKITIINKGSAHPYCLVTEDWNKTHVWGWVDDGSFS